MLGFRFCPLLREVIRSPRGSIDAGIKVFLRYQSSTSEALEVEFEAAKERLSKFTKDVGNETKLKLYSLFKQSVTGEVDTKRPGMMDFVGRAKWDAWKSLGGMSKEEAMKNYILLVESLSKEQFSNEDAAPNVAGTGPKQYPGFGISVKDGVRVICWNRPDKMNAVLTEMYTTFPNVLEEAASDDGTVITVLTGSGSYYSSGNDMSNYTAITPENMLEMADMGRDILIRFIKSFIDFPKILVAVVNGPAMGVAATTLALCDSVYASDKATFQTPFSKLGLSPEACSSYLFPLRMGAGAAAEMLYFNKKISAQEAKMYNLVTEVYPHESLEREVWPRLYELAKLPPKSLMYTKALVRACDKEVLYKVNVAECDRLHERWRSEDCLSSVMEFFKNKGQDNL